MLRKLARGLGRLVLSLIALILIGALVLVLWARSESGRRSLLARVLPGVQARLDGSLSIGALEGNLTRTVVLRGVEVRDAEGEVALRVERLSLTYDLVGLVSRKLTLDDVHVEGAMVHGRSLENGRFNLVALIKPSPPKGPPGKPLEVVIGRVRADIVLKYDPPPEKLWMLPIRGTLHLDGTAKSAGDRREITLNSLAVRMAQPVVAAADVAGAFVDGPGGAELTDLHVTGDTDGAEIEKLSHTVKLRGPWHADVRAKGMLRAMGVEVAVTPPTGAIGVHGTVGVTGAGVTWSGTATAKGIDPGVLWQGAPHGQIAFDGDGDGENARVRTTLAHFDAEVGGTQTRAHGQLTYQAGLIVTAIADVTARDLSRLAALGVPGLSGEAKVHASVERKDGHSTLEAEVDAKRFGAPSTRVAKLTARVRARDLTGTARIQASAITLGSRLHLDDATVTAELGPRVVSLAIAARGPAGSDIIVDAHGARLRSEGPFAVDLALDRVLVAMQGERWESRRAGQLRYDRGGVLAQLALGAGAQRLALNGRYRPGGEVQAHVAGHALDVRRLARLAQVERELPPGALDELDATVRGTAARSVFDVALEGSIPADRALGLARAGYRLKGHYEKERLDGVLIVEKLPLERLIPYLPRPLRTIKGVLEGKATFSGTARAPVVTADLELAKWEWDVLKENHSKLELRYGAQRLDAKLASSFALAPNTPAGALEVELFAPIDLSHGLHQLVDKLVHTTPITAGVRFHAMNLARLPLAKLGVHLPLTAGLVDGDLKLGGTLHDPTLDGDVEAKALTVAGIDRLDFRLHADYRRANLGLRLTTRLRGVPLVAATADTRLDFHKLIDGERWQDAPVTADATVSAYPLSQWKQLEGALTAHATLKGTLARPEGDLDLAVAGLRVGEMRFSRFTGAAHHDAQRSSARFDAVQQNGGAVHGVGELGPGADRPISGRVKVDRLVLALGKGGLGPLRELRGKVNADVTVTGTLAQPHAAGSLNVQEGAFALTTQPLVYHDLQLELAAANDRGELKRLAVKVGNGSLVATGSARLDGFHTPLGVDVSAQANHFPIRLGSFAAFIDGKTTLRGERKDGVLAVVATVSEGLAQLPALVAGKRVQSLAPMPDVVFSDDAAVRKRAAIAAELAEDAPVKASIKAHIPGPFRVRSSELGTDLTGDLDVEILGQVMRITGTVVSTWGRIELLGRRYEIEKVKVSFDGAPKTDPALDIKITRVVDAATVIIRVRGTMSKPQLELSSEPPIFDQSQIIGIIVSGDPGSTRISDAATDQKVVGAISGVLVNQIKNQIAPGLPIDVIRIDNADSASGNSRLEVGKYITQSIYLSYVHQFGAPTGIHPVNSNEAQLQYRFKRHYQLETRFGDAGVGAINFYWSLQY